MPSTDEPKPKWEIQDEVRLFGDNDDPESPEPVFGRKKYFGKYRGTVVNNLDPLRRARLNVTVPGVLNLSPSNWAEPCVPLAGFFEGMYVIPPVGTSVWVEFERGDPGRPIWVGCFWDDPEVPGQMGKLPIAQAPLIAIETHASGVVISDVPVGVGTSPGTVTIYSTIGQATITLGPTGVVVDAPRVAVTGTAVVTIESEAAVSISAKGPVAIESQTAVSVKAPTFSVNGTSLTVTGP